MQIVITKHPEFHGHWGPHVNKPSLIWLISHSLYLLVATQRPFSRKLSCKVLRALRVAKAAAGSSPSDLQAPVLHPTCTHRIRAFTVVPVTGMDGGRMRKQVPSCSVAGKRTYREKRTEIAIPVFLPKRGHGPFEHRLTGVSRPWPVVLVRAREREEAGLIPVTEPHLLQLLGTRLRMRGEI